MADPYRDELSALRQENERLRHALRRRRRRGATIALPGIAVLNFVAIQAVVPLLNAPSESRFFLGVGLVALLVVADVAVLAAVLFRGGE